MNKNMLRVGKKSKNDQKSTEKKEEPKSLNQDDIYNYDEEHIQLLNQQRPWKSNVKFFTNCQISALAAMKMLKHSLAGVKKGREGERGTPIEVMGLLIGKPQGNTIVVMDACPLPVEGIEYKVEVMQEAESYMVNMMESLEKRRKDRFIGWYHSHPFDVGIHPQYFLSATDVQTQAMWQFNIPAWTAIVVDPLRSLAKQEPQLGVFRCYPPEHTPVTAPDGRTGDPKEIAIRWGATPNRYYMLDHSYFMSKLGNSMLRIMSRNSLWIRVLSSSTILEPENRVRLPERVEKANSKLQNLPSQAGRGGFMGRRGGGASKAGGLKEGSTLCNEIAIEQCNGHASQISKNMLFNTLVDAKKEEKQEEKKGDEEPEKGS